MYLCQVSHNLWYQLLLSLTGICFSNKILVSGIPISFSSVTTHFLYFSGYSYQLLLSPYYIVAAQATPYSYSFQLLLSVTPSYSYQLPFSATCNRQSLLLVTVSATLAVPTNLINQSFQQLFSDTSIREHYHVLLSATRIPYSYQVLLSVTLIYSYLLFLTLMYIQKCDVSSNNSMKKNLEK